MKLLKAFYITTCIVNILNLFDLNCILKRIIKQHNLHRIQEISLLEKIISIIFYSSNIFSGFRKRVAIQL